jgi:hypothetical protein
MQHGWLRCVSGMRVPRGPHICAWRWRAGFYHLGLPTFPVENLAIVKR